MIDPIHPRYYLKTIHWSRSSSKIRTRSFIDSYLNQLVPKLDPINDLVSCLTIKDLTLISFLLHLFFWIIMELSYQPRLQWLIYLLILINLSFRAIISCQIESQSNYNLRDELLRTVFEIINFCLNLRSIQIAIKLDELDLGLFYSIPLISFIQRYYTKSPSKINQSEYLLLGFLMVILDNWLELNNIYEFLAIILWAHSLAQFMLNLEVFDLNLRYNLIFLHILCFLDTWIDQNDLVFCAIPLLIILELSINHALDMPYRKYALVSSYVLCLYPYLSVTILSSLITIQLGWIHKWTRLRD